jgi:hypothetical protein
MTTIEGKALALVPVDKKWPALVPLALAMCVVGGWVGHDVFTQGGANLGYVIGNASMTSLLAWVVLYFCFVKKTGRKVGPIYWAFLFATGIASGLAVSGYEMTQAQNATASISHSYEAFLKGETADPKIHSGGEVGQMESWMKAYLATQTTDRHAYQNELAGAGVWSLLLPANLKTDPELTAAKAAVIRGREIVRKYHTLYDSRVTDAYAQIDKLSVSPENKAQLRSGMDESMAKAKAVTDRAWALEAGAIEEMGAVIDLLDANKGTWSITDRPVFQSPAVLASYNEHITNLQQFGKDEATLRAQAIATSRGKMDQLQALTK